MPTYNMGGQQSGGAANLNLQAFLDMQNAAAQNRAKMLQWAAILFTWMSTSNQQTVEQQRSGPIYEALKDSRDALKDLVISASSDADKVRNATVDAIDDVLRGFQAGTTNSQGILSGGGSSGNNNLLLIVFVLFALGGNGMGF